MNEPRTLAELRGQWFQRLVIGGDRLLADQAASAEGFRPVFEASVGRLQQLLQDPKRDRKLTIILSNPSLTNGE